MALDTMGDYIAEARRLMQDEVQPYRYPDADIIEAMNLAIMEARRLRPDLFLGRFNTLPSVSAAGDAIDIEPMYRPAFTYYIVGRTQLRDAESTQDQRAAGLMNKFVSQMLTITS